MPIDSNNTSPITINTCSGNFYDSGDTASWYANNQDATLTICADGTDSEEKIRVSFSLIQFAGDAADLISVYDGDDATAPLIRTINFNENNSTLVVEATAVNTSGCLTFHFVSDASSTWTGWESEISCFVPCQEITASIDSTNPLPVAGVINIEPGDSIDFTASGTFSVSGSWRYI